MSRRVATAVLIGAVLAGCTTVREVNPPDRKTTSPMPADVREHESGPESPIAYGFQVPRGAAQIGPLIRYRSDRLINAYQPQLDAAQARRDADQQRRRDDAEANGTPLPPPTPTPTTAPTNDTFRLLDNPPRPDTTISLMRVNGKPTTVVRAMLAQIDVILPKAGIARSNVRKYCKSQDRRIVSCHLRAKGVARNGRRLAVTLAVDPGDIKTRTSPPATNQHPVMYLRVEYIGDPRDGQVNRRHDSDISVPKSVRRRDLSGLIWPRMDIDAKGSTPLLNGWRAPLGSDILLSGYHPAFVVLATTKALDASNIAAKFATSIQAEPKIDVVEDLNEITTTYTSVGPLGERALASYILSARGYYAVLFYWPPPTPVPVPVPVPVQPVASVQPAN